MYRNFIGSSLFYSIVILIVIALKPALVSADSITLSWDPPTTNTDGSQLTDLAGYIIYYGEKTGDYTDNVDVKNVSIYTLQELKAGTTYYIAGTSYNALGTESDFSEEITHSTLPDNNIDTDGDGYKINEGDCDDENVDVYPGNVEGFETPTCGDGLDNDCDGYVDGTDTGCSVINYFCDNDNDDYFANLISGSCIGVGCEPGGCLTISGNDCDDDDSDVNPSADDSACNGLDENCDGIPDNNYVASITTCGTGGCISIGHFQCINGVEVNTCIPVLPSENIETTCCDGLDNDCDGVTDGNDSDCIDVDYYCDYDNDGYIAEMISGTCKGEGCEPEGCVTIPGTDCYDNASGINPAADDFTCNGIDENCNAVIDDTCSTEECNIDPAGTYINAENYTGTIVQGTRTFEEGTYQRGYLGSGYLRSNGGSSGAHSCPSVDEGKEYEVNFPEAGTYTVWIRGYAYDYASDSLFIGLDGACVGALKEAGINNQWVWTKSIKSGTNTINVTTPGIYTINIWIREANHLIDGIYITKGDETPTDGSHGIEVNPNNCGITDQS